MARTIGSSWPLVPIASMSSSIAWSTLLVPVNFSRKPSFIASTHQRCHRKLCLRRVPKSAMRRSGNALSRTTFSHSFALARAYRTSSSNRPIAFMAARERSSLTIERTGISHSVTAAQGPLKSMRNCPSSTRRSYSGSRYSPSHARNSAENRRSVP